MKAFKTLMLLLALGLSAYGQAVNVTANKLKGSDTAPSGTCGAQRIELTTAGVVWVCASGTWTSSSSGGGTTINSTDGFFPYRSSATAFSNSPMSRVDASTVQVLAINGGSAANDDITIQGTSNATRTTSYTLIEPNGGMVGIGLTAPTAKLEVKGAGTSTGKVLRLTDSSGNESFAVQDNGVTGIGGQSGNLTGVDASTRLKITNGDLWFPGASKIIPGGTASTTISRYASIFGDSGQNDLTFRTYRDYFFETDTGDNTAGTKRLVIKGSTGRVGIGTSTDTADAQLSVYSQSTTRPALKLNMPSGTSASQEAFGVYDNDTLSYAVRTDGKIVYVSGNTGTTVGAAGGASALPATPTGYLQVVIGGTTYKIPYYAN